MALLGEAIEAVQRGEFTGDSDYDLLNDIKELSAPVGVSLKEARLSIDEKTYALTEKLADSISTFQADQEECETTVEGMLERVNVHHAANVFTIYPDVGPTRITCRLPENLAEKGIGAIRRRVAVSGVGKFRKFDPFPHEIVADGIEVYGLDEELPSFADLCGMAPGATGELSSEDFVRLARNEWN
jgi:hypothetical protein